MYVFGKNEWENIPICNCFDFQRFILNGFWVHKVIILITRQLSISGLLITFLTASFIKMRCFKKKVSNLIVNYFSVSSFWHVIGFWHHNCLEKVIILITRLLSKSELLGAFLTTNCFWKASDIYKKLIILVHVKKHCYVLRSFQHKLLFYWK